MLRVGLTGGLGSGKSTVAAWLRELGAHVIEADELGRALMEPGQPVYAEIVRVFGPEVVVPPGSSQAGRLDRARLAQLAFSEGRLHQLNSIVHPAVIAAQQRWMEDLFVRSPRAIAVVESALIFEVERDARVRGESEGALADWRNRFDRIIVLTAAEEVKIARYVARTHPAAEGRDVAIADARLRLAQQMPDQEKAARADFVLENTGDLPSLHRRVAALWDQLKAESDKNLPPGSLK